MSDEPKDEGGIFGKLPDSRPGTRSPRRDNAKAATRKAAPNAKPKATKPKTAKPKASKPKTAKPKSVPKSPPREVPPARPAEPSRPLADQTPGGLGDIAWAGIAVAAEAATIGVRHANRAHEAVRGNPEKD
jgi:hypothetical protein